MTCPSKPKHLDIGTNHCSSSFISPQPCKGLLILPHRESVFCQTWTCSKMELHCLVIWIRFIWCSSWLKLYIFIVYVALTVLFLISTFRSLCGQPIKYLKSSQTLSDSFTKCSTQFEHTWTVSGTPLDCWTWPRRRSSLLHTFLSCLKSPVKHISHKMWFI